MENEDTIPQDSTGGSQCPLLPQKESQLTIPRDRQRMQNVAPRPRSTTQIHSARLEAVPRRKVHWLLPLGIVLLAMLVLWVFGSLALAWGIDRYNDAVYGYPRTYQTNAVVGHGGDSVAHPSHFIALNLNRQAIVIELTAGNPAKSFSYIVPYLISGTGEDLAPVTVEFRDVTGDHKPDMLVHIHLPREDQTFIFVNDGTQFRPRNKDDHIQLSLVEIIGF